ncbi:MAG: hypothetical protein ACRD63_03135, partial [Pyrinomonadaceae bacterium]
TSLTVDLDDGKTTIEVVDCGKSSCRQVNDSVPPGDTCTTAGLPAEAIGVRTTISDCGGNAPACADAPHGDRCPATEARKTNATILWSGNVLARLRSVWPRTLEIS